MRKPTSPTSRNSATTNAWRRCKIMALRVPVRPTVAAPPLAGPGYQRDEQLKERLDQLEETAQTLNDTAGVDAIAPEVMLADEELQQLLAKDGSEVSNARPGYAYMWVCIEYPTTARGINVLSLQAVGWQVVKGDDVEAEEYRTADGTRKLGDAILLRIEARRKQLLDYRIDQLNMKREGATADALKERAAQFGINIVDFASMTPEQQKRLERRAQQEFSKQAATSRLATDLRHGTVPGVAPGA